MSEPTRLGDALDRVLRGLGAPPADVSSQLADEWASIVGAELAAHATVESVVDGRVRIAVDGNAWATEMRYREAAVLGWFDAVAGPGQVTRIDVRVVGTVPPPW